MKKCCWVLAGPTASGKTSLSLQLAQAYQCEIVCMDSMQIYRRMNIGTAKPTPSERAQAVHHMVDVVEPTEDFSVARYQEMAEACIEEIFDRGHQPLLVGGTGLYLRALRRTMSMGEVAADERLRAELQQLADSGGGKEQLHQALTEVDPVTAARLHVNDVRRVIRALEVYRLTGRPISQQPESSTSGKFDYRVASLTMDRAALYRRIEQRVDQMIADGLAEEVKQLLAEGLTVQTKAMKAIGYKEMIPYCLGQCTLDAAVAELKLNTRHYAKRQLTWMRSEPDILWVDALAPDAYEQLSTYYLQGAEKDDH